MVASGGEIILEGYSEEHLIEDVYFMDCYNAGEKIAAPEDITTNQFVKNISFSDAEIVSSNEK